jgi:hypothetical protein
MSQFVFFESGERRRILELHAVGRMVVTLAGVVCLSCWGMLGVLGVASDISNRYHALRTIIVIKEMTHGGKESVYFYTDLKTDAMRVRQEGAVMISSVRLLFARTD